MVIVPSVQVRIAIRTYKRRYEELIPAQAAPRL